MERHEELELLKELEENLIGKLVAIFESTELEISHSLRLSIQGESYNKVRSVADHLICNTVIRYLAMRTILHTESKKQYKSDLKNMTKVIAVLIKELENIDYNSTIKDPAYINSLSHYL